jgi:NitT/TauT family transport system permease protein
MAHIPRFFGIHAEPTRVLRVILGILPFVILFGTYLTVSDIRRAENPSDKLTPSLSQMAEAVHTMAFTKDRRTGQYLMLEDTIASLKRIGIGLGMAAFVGLFLGINTGMQKGLEATLLPVITFASIVPPLAVLPVLFILFGVDELGKVMLIFLGALFVITRDIYQETRQIPREQIVKALTLGASQFQVIYRVLLPQIMPRLLVTIRLCLGGAWLFLIASEAIASTNGLGYRIFLMRRYLAMDVIIPYVLWITIIGFTMDLFLRALVRRKYPWYFASE